MQKLNKKDILSSLNITLRLFAVCTVIAILVASVNFVTEDRISALEFEKTTDALNDVFWVDVNEPEYKELDIECIGTVTGAYEVLNNSETVGYGVLCEPVGFKDVIKLLVAFDSDKTVISVKVISLSETAGFGDKVMKEPWFNEQFTGYKTNVVLGGNINAISGATISSKAVVKGVNDAISTMIYTGVNNMEVAE